MCHPHVQLFLTCDTLMAELDRNALTKERNAIFFLTLRSSSLKKITDFVTTQYAIQYFCQFTSKRLDPIKWK